MQKMAAAGAIGILVLTLGCVIRTQHTIDAHVTVDIRRIEEQAENVLDFVEGKSDTLPPLKEEEPTSWHRRVWDSLNPMRTAHAQELNTASPEMTEIAKRMRDRHSQIAQYKQAGVFGEDNRGYIELFETEAIDDPAKMNTAQQLKSAENADRKAMYKEIVMLNEEENVSVAQVEQIFAYKRLERAKAGEKFQLPPSGKYFDQFKQTDACKRLGDDCQPGAWVTIK